MAMENGSGSPMVRRQLGRKLRRLREEAGKTHADVEVAQIASISKMYRMESGKTTVKPGDIWALARLYQLPDEVAGVLVSLARGTRDEGWLEQYASAVPQWLSLYAGLEAAAAHIDAYHPELIAGLLQTADYARAIIATNADFTRKVVDQRVAFRMERQKAVFERPAPARVRAVLGSAAMCMVVGSVEVMRAQVEHLRKLSACGLVEVRVRPWRAGPHQNMNGSFTLMNFADTDDPDLAHVETYAGSKYIERPEQVEQFRKLHTMLTHTSVPIQEYTP
jgi:transcriptional regulator with XRE-family HTH domain